MELLHLTSPLDLHDSLFKISKLIEVSHNMELFIKKIASIMSNGAMDTKVIIDTLLIWKSTIEETHKIKRDLLESVNEGGSLYKQLEKKIRAREDYVSFISSVEEIFKAKCNDDLLSDIRECLEFRNVVSPYIIKYTEIMGTTNSSKCLEDIVEILERNVHK